MDKNCRDSAKNDLRGVTADTSPRHTAKNKEPITAGIVWVGAFLFCAVFSFFLLRHAFMEATAEDPEVLAVVFAGIFGLVFGGTAINILKDIGSGIE